MDKWINGWMDETFSALTFLYLIEAQSQVSVLCTGVMGNFYWNIFSLSLSSPFIFLDGGILEQYEEEEHTAFRSALFFTASRMLRREAEVVHLQLSKLLKSILYSYRHEFWNEKTSKCGNDKDRQTYRCWTARLPFVISLSVWSSDREILRKPSSIFALSLNWKVAIKSAGQDTLANTALPNAVQADSALSFLEISYRPLKAAVLNLPEKR